MFPTFELFGKTFGTYTLLALAGILVAGVYACRTAAARGFDDNDMIVFGLVGAVGVLLGGHVLYGLTDPQRLLAFFRGLGGLGSLREFLESAVLTFGGSVFYGGLLGGMLAAGLYARKKGLDLQAFSDMAAPAVPLFHVFGRVGCFMGGCCYGIPSPVGFVYTHSLLEPANGVCRFPVQLLEAAFNLALFGLLHVLLVRGRCKGRLFCLYLLVYSAGRFFLEFLRGDDLRGIFFGLSTSQWISLPLFAAAGLLLLREIRRQKSLTQR